MNQLSLFSDPDPQPQNQTQFNPDNWGTPDLVAKYMAALTPRFGLSLEPSAGRGQIAKYLEQGDCIEVDSTRFEIGRKTAPHCNWYCADFLSLPPKLSYQCVVMNPPFSAWIKFILKAEKWLTNNGGETIIALIPTQRKQNQKDAIALANSGLRIKRELAIVGRVAFLRDGKIPENTDNYNTSILIFERGKFGAWETEFVDPLGKTNRLF